MLTLSLKIIHINKATSPEQNGGMIKKVNIGNSKQMLKESQTREPLGMRHYNRAQAVSGETCGSHYRQIKLNKSKVKNGVFMAERFNK